MPEFRFSFPVQIRYMDIDAQGVVNNVNYFLYMAEARIAYARKVGLWDAFQGFLPQSVVVAEASCSYKRPIRPGQSVSVGVRVARLGGKSMEMEYQIVADGEVAAVGRTVQVAYDYVAGSSRPIPEEWRERIRAFEGGSLAQA